ncbi:hypothetical protein FHG87_004206, partial [Trinorchestia longiramus]
HGTPPRPSPPVTANQQQQQQQQQHVTSPAAKDGLNNTRCDPMPPSTYGSLLVTRGSSPTAGSMPLPAHQGLPPMDRSPPEMLPHMLKKCSSPTSMSTHNGAPSPNNSDGNSSLADQNVNYNRGQKAKDKLNLEHIDDAENSTHSNTNPTKSRTSSPSESTFYPSTVFNSVHSFSSSLIGTRSTSPLNNFTSIISTAASRITANSHSSSQVYGRSSSPYSKFSVAVTTATSLNPNLSHAPYTTPVLDDSQIARLAQVASELVTALPHHMPKRDSLSNRKKTTSELEVRPVYL